MQSDDKKKPAFFLEREFDFPIEKVWKTWTESERVKCWWGPRDFTVPYVAIDFRVGGKYLYSMRGKVAPDAPEKDYWSTGVFREIVPVKKIVVTDNFADEKGNIVPATYYGMSSNFPLEMTVIISFSEERGKTKLTLEYPSLGNISEEDRRNMEDGWNQSLDKFAGCLR